MRGGRRAGCGGAAAARAGPPPAPPRSPVGPAAARRGPSHAAQPPPHPLPPTHPPTPPLRSPRSDELALFQEALRETLDEATAAAAAALDAQRTALKVAARELRAARGGTPPAAVAALVARLSADAAAMGDGLLRREVAAHEAVEAMLDVLESAVLELRGVKLAQHDVFFRALEAAVALFTDGLGKTAEALMLDADADRLPAELDEELSSLLNDREAMLGVLAASSDARIARILRRESELRAREDARCTGAVRAARAAELARNRARVVEIRAVVEAAKARIAEDIAAAAEEEDEDEPVKR